MEKLKDCLPGLPEVGFHRWQSYLSLFSLKRPNLGFSCQRWAFPLRWCKGGLKRLYLALFAKGGLFSFGSLYFARGGLPSLAVLEDGAKDLRGFKAAKVGFFGFDGAKVGFHRWQSYLSLFSLKRPNLGFSCQRWAFPLRWCKGGLKRLYLALFAKGGLFSFGSPYFARGGLPVLPEVGFHRWQKEPYNNIKVGFEAAKDLRRLPEVGFFGFHRWQSWKVGFSPLVGFDGAKVGFHRWQSSRLPELAELPKEGFSPLVLNDCQRWASLALFGLIWAYLPEVGFSCCLYTL